MCVYAISSLDPLREGPGLPVLLRHWHPGGELLRVLSVRVERVNQGLVTVRTVGCTSKKLKNLLLLSRKYS